VQILLLVSGGSWSQLSNRDTRQTNQGGVHLDLVLASEGELPRYMVTLVRLGERIDVRPQRDRIGPILGTVRRKYYSKGPELRTAAPLGLHHPKHMQHPYLCRKQVVRLLK